MRQVIFNVSKCSSECPFFRKDDGGGHCDSFIMCDKHHKEIYLWDKNQIVDGFPIWCTLKEVKD